ncbi:MAG: 50S ribosomal protein L16 3-hydroxylase [Rhodocyclaceae bacterium]|nr:50S ribosomal protein L16 3-hydroxylase [Rhodocyclaceae bacterium]
MTAAFLGGLSPAQFLRRHWQKRPLLVRGAFPDIDGLLDPAALFALAARDDVESRLVERPGGRWRLRHGPFALEELSARTRARRWTVLVQGVDTIHDGAHTLLRRFDFLPYARVDDVMVSYATHGGGVGPHFDFYDVFLIQGKGRRRWRVGMQTSLALVEDAPLRLLADFRPDEEWVLEPGDLLYLPPCYAHDGIAQGECMTFSVGFRAPAAQELAEAFLAWLPERLALAGRIADPGRPPTSTPGAIPADMLTMAQGFLRGIRWNGALVGDFLGEYLSEPKPNVFFDPPARPMSRSRFTVAAAMHGLRLDRRSRLLYLRGHYYLNGEQLASASMHALGPGGRRRLRRLADRRRLAASALTDAEGAFYYQCYRDGFVWLNEE